MCLDLPYDRLAKTKKRNYIVAALFFLLLNVAPYLICAQQKRFRFYTADDGLPSNTIPSGELNTIYQDKDGFIWFATFGGISIYDGYHFKNYTKENGGLTTDVALNFFQRSSNEVWVTEPNCIDIFVNRKKTRTIFINTAISLLHTVDGRVLVNRGDSICEIRNNKPVGLTTCPKFVDWMQEIGNNFLIEDFGHDSVYLLDRSFQKVIARMKGQVFKDGLNRIWYFNSKFYLLDTFALRQGNFRMLPAPQALKSINLPGKRLSDFLADSDGFYWIIIRNEKANEFIKGENGVTRIDANGEAGHFNIRADHLFEDADRNIWVVYDAGYVRFSNKYNDFFGLEEGVPSERVLGLAEDTRTGAVWISHEQGISCIFKSQVFNFSVPVRNQIRLLVLGDSLWVGGDRLVLYKISYKPDPKIQLLRQWIPGTDDGIWYMQPDDNGSMFFNIAAEGLFCAKADGTLQLIRVPDSFSFYIDKDVLWVSSLHGNADSLWSGLTRWKMTRAKDSVHIQLLQRYPYVPGGRLDFLTKDAAGNFWVSTVNAGVVKLEKQKNDTFIIRSYDSQRQLSNLWISRIRINDRGEIFASTFGGGGVYQVHPIKDSFYYEDLTAKWGVFLGSWDFLQDSIGNFWLATPAGAVHVRNDLYKKSLPPKVFFSQLLKNNQPDSSIFNTAVSKKFSYSDNNLIFEFSATSFRDESKVLYSYQLEKDHVVGEWSAPKPVHTVSLLSLSPGSYTLKVKALTPDHVWSETPAQYNFITAPPFWNTWWFRVLAMLGIVSIIFSLYKYRVNQLKKMIAVRTKISRDLHDEVGSTLSGIGLLSEVALQQLDKEKEEEVRKSLSRISTNSEEMLDKMSDIVWTINPQNDSFEKVIRRLKAYAKTTTESLGVQLHFHSAEDIEQLNLDMQKRNNIYLICKEAINNAAKYSECRNLNFRLLQKDHQISISIIDDGKGFDMRQDLDGNGLKNMRSRAEEIKANLKMDSEVGSGTSINLYIKIT
jgi:ligand-binding sensor domain-containing protein/two-component sensor histidine kinase